MNKLINETIPFYNMLLWLNMRTNSKNNMVLGDSILENRPFTNVLNNTGIDSVIKSLSSEHLNVVVK